MRSYNQPAISVTYEDWLSQKEFTYFDGLRTISIVAVIIYHASPHFSVANCYTNSGYIGVDLFFVISGFLITTLLIREKIRNGSINIRYFYTRRMLRIFPLYFSLLFFHLFLASYVIRARYPVESQTFIHNFWYFFTYTSNWFVKTREDMRTIFAFAWSLATEEQFYLIWPMVLFLFACSLRPLLFVFSLLLMTTALPLIPHNLTALLPPLFVTMATSVSPALCMGVILSIVLHSQSGEKLYLLLSNKYYSNMSLFLLVVCYMMFSHGLIPKLILIFMITCVVACLSTNTKHFLTWFFSNKILKSFGKVSYGMYMYHMLVLNAVILLAKLIGFNNKGLYSVIVTIILSYLTAYVSYHWFENIFIEIKKKYAA